MADESTTGTTAGTAAPADKSGTSELDRLLNDYVEGKPAPAAQPDTTTFAPVIEALKPVAQYAERKMREEQEVALKKSVDDAIASVKSDEALKPVSDKLVRGFLQDQYANDSGFKAAYDNRTKDPKAWDSALSNARTSFKEELKSLNGQSFRSDVEAATAAVRGAGRGSSPEGPKVDPGKLREMSDTEFARFKREQQARSR